MVAYLIMCFEKYVAEKYPEKDMTLAVEIMWNIVDHVEYIDVAAYRFLEIIPDYLYEAPDYKSLEMESITESEYDALINIIPKPDVDPDLNLIMHRIYDVAMEFVYTEVNLKDPTTKKYIKEVDDILEKNDITLPDVNVLPKYEMDETRGWGVKIDAKPLSIILRK